MGTCILLSGLHHIFLQSLETTQSNTDKKIFKSNLNFLTADFEIN